MEIEGSCSPTRNILRDNLGSITHLVDSAGNVVQELSYTPWGQLRDPVTLRPYAPDSLPEPLLGRGFTGHEHLTAFGLINMNARLYDPAAGRFLNPDPVIQAPDNSQNLNRYSYCLNNPLRYVDLTGKFFIGKYREMFYTQRDILKQEAVDIRTKMLLTDDKNEIEYLKEQLSEILRSIDDIDMMEKDYQYEYRFGSLDNNQGIKGPYADRNPDTHIVTLYTDGSRGNIVHEMRHGGQYARGELDNDNYNVIHEIDAYRAQIAATGSLEYLNYIDFEADKILGIKVGLFGLKTAMKIETNFNNITPDFIRKMWNGEGYNIHQIYNFPSQWYTPNLQLLNR